MFRILIQLVIFFTFPLFIFAESYKPQIFKGEIELKGGIIKTGSLNIDFEKDLVRFYNVDGTVNTYSPFNIVSVYFYDEFTNQSRIFVTLEHPPKKNTNSKYYLFELMKVGKMDILRKSMKNTDYSRLKGYSFGKRVSEYNKCFEYYIFFNGSLIPLSEFHSSILPIIKKKIEEKVETFIAERQIDLRDKLQPLMVVEYFNAISSSKRIDTMLN